jgi:Transmembrane amino acid transporter protein.
VYFIFVGIQKKRLYQTRLYLYLLYSFFSLAQSVNAIFAVAIFISYGLQCYVPVEIIWSRYLKQHLENATPGKKLLVEYIMRVSVVLVTCE